MVNSGGWNKLTQDMLPRKPMDRISSREPYRSLAEECCCNTGAFRRCQDIHNNIETFLSPVGLQGSDNQTLHQPMQRICESSTEALSFVQKLISENLRLRQTLEKRMHIFHRKNGLLSGREKAFKSWEKLTELRRYLQNGYSPERETRRQTTQHG